MSIPLLATKFYFPPGRQNLVPRSRLIERLQQGLTGPLTLISAPAGYGKTTLISEWHAGIGRSTPTAWLSLDPDDNDPARFLTCLIGALETVQPRQCEAALTLLRSPHPPPVQSILTVLLNELGQADEPFALMLDDYHFVAAQSVHETLAFILKHQPPQMHLVILTRADPPLPLARLRVRNQLVDIRADHLRFTLDEIAVFLNTVMGLKLCADDITALEARTEGWIAGLQLAALSMQGCPDVHSFVSAFTGSHYYIMDYLAEEVLKLQPERVRSFLLQTSILDRLCGPLCDAVTSPHTPPPVEEEMEAGSSQAMLETLEQMNLFLIPLDGERRWYRYHHLFADVLNRRLERQFPHRLPELNRCASQWYEQNGFIPEATHHALMAGDQDRAAQLVEQNGCALLMRGEVVTLLKWIEAVESYAPASPWLAIQKAWALLLAGRLDRVEQALQAAEQLISSLEPSLEARTMRGIIVAARAQRSNQQGDTRLAADFAHQALEQLLDSDSFSCSLRSVVTSILGDACRINGDLEEAKHAYTEAMQIGRAANDPQMVIIASSSLAGILMEQGQLCEAARLYSEALSMATRPDGRGSPLAEGIYAGLSVVSCEWNHLETAVQHIHQCIQLCRQWEDKDLHAMSYVTLARLQLAQGNSDKAQEAMRATEQLAGEYPLSPRQSIWIKSSLARLWLALGDLDRACHFVQQSGITIADDVSYPREPEYLVLLRVLLAQGDYDAALALSERLLKPAEATHRVGRIIEVLVLQALAFQGKKEMAQALAVLHKALALAQPEGYARTFLDEGEPMAKLLYQAKSSRMGAGYAAELLSAMGRAWGAAEPPAQLLIEPMSSRELQVLELIKAGCSNQDIAAKLVISIATVKRHISNIYAKLGVESRTQAISRGRELGLFE